MKKFENVLKASASEGIVAVIPGLPFDAEGFFLTEEQMSNIDASLATAESATTALAAANDLAATANALSASTQQELATAQANLATANADLATAQARVAELEARTGQPAKTGKAEDKFESGDPKKYETSYDKMVF